MRKSMLTIRGGIIQKRDSHETDIHGKHGGWRRLDGSMALVGRRKRRDLHLFVTCTANTSARASSTPSVTTWEECAVNDLGLTREQSINQTAVAAVLWPRRPYQVVRVECGAPLQ